VAAANSASVIEIVSRNVPSASNAKSFVRIAAIFGLLKRSLSGRKRPLSDEGEIAFAGDVLSRVAAERVVAGGRADP
jgi:hypothetical protein